jgi:hypothetical protein
LVKNQLLFYRGQYYNQYFQRFLQIFSENIRVFLKKTMLWYIFFLPKYLQFESKSFSWRTLERFKKGKKFYFNLLNCQRCWFSDRSRIGSRGRFLKTYQFRNLQSLS